MSAVLAPSGATANSDSSPSSKLEQKICSQLLGLSGAELVRIMGGDSSAASRIKSGERALNWLGWTRLLTGLGYKIVPKTMICAPDYEMRMLRDAYAFICSSPEQSARFSAFRETQPLTWEDKQ